jgi:hypothetical protein
MNLTIGIYNQISTRSASYQQHIKSITDFSINHHRFYMLGDEFKNNLNVVSDSDVNVILEKALEHGSDYLYLVSYGYVTRDPFLPYLIIDLAKQNNYSIVGHVMDDYPHNKGFYFLHNQCMLINLKDYVEVGKPKFTLGASLSEEELPNIIRTDGNFHDDYTPFFIKKGTGTKIYTGFVHEGWKFIKSFIEYDKVIGNFTEDIRDKKHHLYPENGEGLEKVLSGDVEATVWESNQLEWLQSTDINNFKNPDVFIFNTCPDIEQLSYTKETYLDSIYCVASGFMPLKLLDMCRWDSNTTMVYFDFNQIALDFKKYLIENWDGTKYIETVLFYKNNIDIGFQASWFTDNVDAWEIEWQKTIEYFGGLASWLEFWSKYKTIKHKFMYCDIMQNNHELLDTMKEHTGNNLIWFSNIFHTRFTIRYYHPVKIKSLYDDFIKLLSDSNSTVQVCGFDTTGQANWFCKGTIQ